MSTFAWIIVSGFLMSCIALVGSVTLVVKTETLDKILLPLVAFANEPLTLCGLLRWTWIAFGRSDSRVGI